MSGAHRERRISEPAPAPVAKAIGSPSPVPVHVPYTLHNLPDGPPYERRRRRFRRGRYVRSGHPSRQFEPPVRSPRAGLISSQLTARWRP